VDQSTQQATQQMAIQRRDSPRDPLSCLVRVRESDPAPAGIERAYSTENISSGGIYFVTETYAFRKRTQLFLSFPRGLGTLATLNGFRAEVVRVDSLLRGRCGVAAKLLDNIRLRLRDGLIVPEGGFWKHWPPVTPEYISLYA
jgi:hypothetical protein